jgi:hypothetical protein
MEIIRKIPVLSEQCRSGQSDSTGADSDPFDVACGSAEHPARRVPIRTNIQSFLNGFIRSPFQFETIFFRIIPFRRAIYILNYSGASVLIMGDRSELNEFRAELCKTEASAVLIF